MRNILLALAIALGLSVFTIGCVALPAASPAVYAPGEPEGLGSISATGPFTGTSGTFTSTLNVSGRTTTGGLTSSAVLTGTAGVFTDTLTVTGRTTTGGLTTTGAFTATTGVFTDTLNVTGRTTTGGLTASDTITGTNAVLTGTLGVTGRTTTGGLTSSQTITGTNAVLTGTLAVTGRTTTGGLTSSAVITGTNAVFTGTLDVQGSTSFGRAAILSQTTITATDGITITPVYNVYKLNTAGNVAIGLEPCSGQGGFPLYLYGLDANTITISDTNVLTTDGNAATLGQYDVVGWMCDGTNWAHLFKSANQ